MILKGMSVNRVDKALQILVSHGYNKVTPMTLKYLWNAGKKTQASNLLQATQSAYNAAHMIYELKHFTWS